MNVLKNILKILTINIVLMARQTAAPGTCFICEEPVTKRTFVTHLLKNHKEESGGTQFIIMVDTPYASPYWMALIASPDATLRELDNMLRDVWVECCGHLSAFTISGVEYLTSYDGDLDDDDGFSKSESMRIKIKRILEPGMAFKYEYDFGTTTLLRLKIVDSIIMDEPKKSIIVVGMNNKPEAVCSECGKPAVYHYGEWDDEQLLCKTCASDEEVDECYLLPICNSPRTGLCGFEGGRYDSPPDEQDWDEDEEED